MNNNNVWGPPAWTFLHTVTYNYPENPTNEDKSNYLNFFDSLKHVIPCDKCKGHYKENLKKYDLNNSLNSRKDLARWFYDIHNLVNDKLDVSKEDRPKNFKQFYNRYEKFRSKCGNKRCIQPTDGVAKKSVIKIIDKNGKDYCINTSDETRDQDILSHYEKTNDYNILHLLSDTAKYLLKQAAQLTVTNNNGDTDKAKEIIKNI